MKGALGVIVVLAPLACARPSSSSGPPATCLAVDDGEVGACSGRCRDGDGEACAGVGAYYAAPRPFVSDAGVRYRAPIDPVLGKMFLGRACALGERRGCDGMRVGRDEVR